MSQHQPQKYTFTEHTHQNPTPFHFLFSALMSIMHLFPLRQQNYSSHPYFKKAHWSKAAKSAEQWLTVFFGRSMCVGVNLYH